MTITVTPIDDWKDYAFSGRAINTTKAKNEALRPYHKQLHCFGRIFEMRPDTLQAEQINRTIGCARAVKNDYLSYRINLYREEKRSIFCAEYRKTILPVQKKEKPWLKDVDKFALESAIEQVDDAYSNFFERKTGFPKFASKYTVRGNSYTTKFTNNNIRFLLNDRGIPCIRLPKIGMVPFVFPKNTRFRDICPAGTHITKATVRRIGKKYFVSVSFETVIDEIVPIKDFSPGEVFGCDVGLKHFCCYGTLEEKHTVENPRWIRRHERRLRRLQKALSRKMYDSSTHIGSKNYYKAKERVRREHEKIRNQRRDFQHKLSRKIADSCKVFVCEDLNIRGMMKNRRLSKSIASVGWGRFLTYVRYKLEHKGGLFVKADKWFASSQTCSACGYKNPKVKDLKVRSWVCPECGAIHDRDDNAVNNLIRYAVNNLRKKKVSA